MVVINIILIIANHIENLVRTLGSAPRGIIGYFKGGGDFFVAVIFSMGYLPFEGGVTLPQIVINLSQHL